MKKLIALTILVATLCAQVPSGAQTPPGPRADVAQVAPLKKGGAAPFDGVLISQLAAAMMLAKEVALEEKLRLAAENATAIAVAKCEKSLADADAKSSADKKILEVKLVGEQRRTDIVSAALQQQESKSTASGIVWALMGAAGGVIFTLVTMFVVGQASK
jgi:hypothetical protein